MKAFFSVSLFLSICIFSFGQATLPFSDGFESGSFNTNWSPFPNISGQYGLVAIEDGAGTNGTYGVKIGKTQDEASFTTNSLSLYLDLSGYTNVEMTFWIAGHYDETNLEDGIYFSNDGGDFFTKVVDFFPDEWCNDQFGQHPPLDVDRLASAAGLTLTSQFIIKFQQKGKDDFSGYSSGSGDGFVIDDVKVYDPNLIYSTLPFTDDFELGYLGDSWVWNFADKTSTISTGYAITNPMSTVEIADGLGVNNSNAVKMGKICDGEFTTNALDLHLDLSGETNVEMSFWIADHYDESQIDEGIYFSDDGGINFVKVLDFFPDEWCDDVLSKHPPLDIDRLASNAGLFLTNQFVVRFQQMGKDDFSGYSSGSGDGFILDDVKVYNPNLVYSSLPFSDDFNLGYMNSSWAWNFADKTSTISTGFSITNPMSKVEVVDDLVWWGSPCVKMGRVCDGDFTTNALDLHLNLSGETNVEMIFDIADHYDEDQIDEGIYFSDNGGNTFIKVVDFFPEGWCDDKFSQHPPLDVDELAVAVGLSLTSQFVIRFQQMGQNDFSGNSSSSGDGFYIDNVEVYDPELVYATLPFSDNFDLGVFAPSWAWKFADKTSTIVSGDAITNPMSIVGIGYESGINYTNCALLGKVCDGTYTTNAFDLHLNLLNKPNVNLSFWIADHYDETEVDDGVYFSDDGGNTFFKVYSFDFSNTPNDEYQEYALDVDALASAKSLNLTDHFVIRFQQYGKNDFWGNSSSSGDGFYLDDVSVIEGPTALRGNQLEYVNVFPNPANDILYVDGIKGEYSYQIFDFQGRLVKQSLSISNTIDTSKLIDGIYTIAVFDGRIWTTHKLILVSY